MLYSRYERTVAVRGRGHDCTGPEAFVQKGARAQVETLDVRYPGPHCSQLGGGSSSSETTHHGMLVYGKSDTEGLPILTIDWQQRRCGGDSGQPRLAFVTSSQLANSGGTGGAMSTVAWACNEQGEGHGISAEEGVAGNATGSNGVVREVVIWMFDQQEAGLFQRILLYI